MFLDTSGLLCILDPTEPLHREAVGHLAASRPRLTHNVVLVELVALALSRGISPRSTLDFVGKLEENTTIRIVYIDAVYQALGMRMLKARPDKVWSLCDAISFVLMQKYDEVEALTTDHHFQQAGFVRLLGP